MSNQSVWFITWLNIICLRHKTKSFQAPLYFRVLPHLLKVAHWPKPQTKELKSYSVKRKGGEKKGKKNFSVSVFSSYLERNNKIHSFSNSSSIGLF